MSTEPNQIAHHPNSCVVFNLKSAFREKKDRPGTKAEEWRNEDDAPLIVRIKMDGYPSVLGHAGTREAFNASLAARVIQNQCDPSAVHAKMVNITKRDLSGKFGPIPRNYVLRFLSETEAATFVFCLNSFYSISLEKKTGKVATKMSSLKLQKEEEDSDEAQGGKEEDDYLLDDLFPSTQDPFGDYVDDL